MSSYGVDIHILEDGGIVSIGVPENITKDVAGNGNLASNILQVKHCKDKIFYFLYIYFKSF